MGDVVAQHVVFPQRKGAFGFETVVGGLLARPNLCAPLADFSGRYVTDDTAGFGCTERRGFPAADHRGIEQEHPASELRMARCTHGAEDATERMADKPSFFACFLDQRLHEICELLHDMRPIIGDGVARVVPELVNRLNSEASFFERIEHHAIGAGWEAVAVREDEQAQISFSSGVEIFFKGMLRVVAAMSGASVWPPFHCGSSKLSNTSRNLPPHERRSI